MISISEMWALRHRSLSDIPKDTEETSGKDKKSRVPDISALLSNHKTACLLCTSEIFPLLLGKLLFRGASVLFSFCKIRCATSII